MKLVINVPDYIKEQADKGRGKEFGIPYWLVYEIANGTPLPKRHGRLIILSEDEVKREQVPLNFSCQNWISEVGLSNATVAITEADKTEVRIKNESN